MNHFESEFQVADAGLRNTGSPLGLAKRGNTKCHIAGTFIVGALFLYVHVLIIQNIFVKIICLKWVVSLSYLTRITWQQTLHPNVEIPACECTHRVPCCARIRYHETPKKLTIVVCITLPVLSLSLFLFLSPVSLAPVGFIQMRHGNHHGSRWRAVGAVGWQHACTLYIRYVDTDCALCVDLGFRVRNSSWLMSTLSFGHSVACSL